jgi:hypothetical protein
VVGKLNDPHGVPRPALIARSDYGRRRSRFENTLLGDWEILVAEAQDRSAQDLDGQPATVRDTVLRAARRR